MARLEDLPEVLALERQIPEAPHWTEGMYRECLTQPVDAIQKRVLLVVTMDVCVRGFAALTAVSGEAELESIAVAEDARRWGLGSALLDAATCWAKEQGAGTLRLEVRAANVRAQSFYMVRGFRKQGLRPGYYRDPADDAVLMLRNVIGELAGIESEEPGDPLGDL